MIRHWLLSFGLTSISDLEVGLYTSNDKAGGEWGRSHVSDTDYGTGSIQVVTNLIVVSLHLGSLFLYHNTYIVIRHGYGSRRVPAMILNNDNKEGDTVTNIVFS